MILTEQEKLLAEKLGFQKSSLVLLKKGTHNSVTQYAFFNDENEVFNFSEKAVVSNVCNGEKSIRNIQKWLIGKNEFAFLSKIKNREPNQIAIIKAKNQFDILHFQKTDGGSHGISTTQIIDKLTLWDKLFGVNIIGASSSWILFEIKKMPKDIEWFANELNEFCPDILDQNFGEIEKLIENLKTSNEIQLWWD
jgi:hypothetical protein